MIIPKNYGGKVFTADAPLIFLILIVKRRDFQPMVIRRLCRKSVLGPVLHLGRSRCPILWVLENF